MKTNTITLLLFDSLIKINFHTSSNHHNARYFYNYINKYYRAYIVDSTDNAHFIIDYVSQFESLRLLKRDSSYFVECFKEEEGGRYTLYYHLDPALVHLLIRRIVLITLSHKNGFMLHSSSVLVDQQAAIFCGFSGTGKSTLAQSLKNNFKLFSDDLTCIFKQPNGNYLAFQYPGPEKNTITKTPSGYEITGVFFLKRSHYPHIALLPKSAHISANLANNLFTEQEFLNSHMKTAINFMDKYSFFYTFHMGTIKEDNTYFIQFITRTT